MACNKKIAKLMKDNKGTLPAHAWPGGCPLLYLTSENSHLCPECAQRIASNPEDWEQVVEYIAYEEGPTIECDGGCGTMIESSYGDPEDPEENA